MRPGATPPALRLDALSKRYGPEYAVRDLSLALEPGTFTTILGPSGSGKSTTLRLVAGLERADAGTVLIGGADATRQPPHRRDCAMVFQHYALFPHRTVAENVAFGLARRGVPRREADRRVEELLDLVGLPGQGTKAPDQLSGGQRQRVALARALAVEPAILLLDEPLGALDLSLRRQLQGELRSIQRDSSRTFLHVTHDQDEALALSDQVVVMAEGRIVQSGTPEAIYERPTSRFVAEFLGFANILPAAPIPGGIRIAGQSVAMPISVPAADSLVAAIRSEHVRVGRPEPGGLALDGVVLQSTYAGASWTIRFRLGDGQMVEATSDRAFPPGSPVELAVEPRHIVPLSA